MRLKLIITLMLLIVCAVLHAQELTIKSFEPSREVIQGKDQRKDRNHKPCALLKVKVALTSVVFEGDIVGEPVYKTGEYWVFVPQGTPKVRIKHAQYLPLDIQSPYSNEVQTLQSNRVYALILERPKTDGNSLIFNVQPRSATVTVDGEPVKINTNGFGSTILSLGTHHYTVKADGYVTKTADVNMENDAINLDVVLEKTTSSLLVETPMKDAKIYINGDEVGKQRWSSQVEPGEYEVKIARKGYSSYSETVNIAWGDNKVVKINGLSPDEKPKPAPVKTTTEKQKLSGVYIEPCYQALSFSGVGASVGGYLSNFNLEAQYIYGLSKSDDVYWYSSSDGSSLGSTKYKASRMAVRVGYGITIARKLQVMPQLGMGLLLMSKSGGNVADFDKSYAASLLVSARCVFSFTKNLQVALTPEYSLGVSKGKTFEAVSNISSKVKSWASGFNIRLGFSVMF